MTNVSSVTRLPPPLEVVFYAQVLVATPWKVSTIYASPTDVTVSDFTGATVRKDRMPTVQLPAIAISATAANVTGQLGE